MKCTCKDYQPGIHYTSEPIRDYVFKFCPWCGSPLLPDSVEKVEWWITSDGPIARSDCFYCWENSARAELDRLTRDFPSFTHTIKSITTIERTIEVVRPA